MLRVPHKWQQLALGACHTVWATCLAPPASFISEERTCDRQPSNSCSPVGSKASSHQVLSKKTTFATNFWCLWSNVFPRQWPIFTSCYDYSNWTIQNRQVYQHSLKLMGNKQNKWMPVLPYWHGCTCSSHAVPAFCSMGNAAPVPRHVLQYPKLEGDTQSNNLWTYSVIQHCCYCKQHGLEHAIFKSFHRSATAFQHYFQQFTQATAFISSSPSDMFHVWSQRTQPMAILV